MVKETWDGLQEEPLSSSDLVALDKLRDTHPRLWKHIRECGQAVLSYKEEVEVIKKRRGAEVLAACIAECRRLFDEIWDSEHGESAKLNVIERLIPRLEKLQPAASDLEALLREEWNKAIESAANSAWNFMQGGGMWDDDDIAAEIRALRKEKARAEGKG